jgi:streptogramin lyase
VASPARVARAAASCGLAVLALLVLTSSADAFIYWADSQNQKIGRANNDGSGVDGSFIQTGQLPFAIAVDSSHIYWANQNSNSIGRANIDGTGVDNSFIAGVKEPSGVAVNGSKIFWSTIPGPIGRANIDGSKKEPSFITAAVLPCGVALDSGHIYWADDTGPPAYIGRASLDGSNPAPTYVTIPGTSFPCGVAVNAANIFWADTGFFGGGTRIGRANTNTGEGADPSIIGDASTPCGVALDGSSHLYWANTATNTIGRANTDSTGVNQNFVVTGGNAICAVAVDALVAAPAPAGPGPADVDAPQTTIATGPGKNLGRGEAKFSFKSNEAGSHFECKLDGKKVARCKSPRRYKHLKPGRHTFRAWAIDAAGNKDGTPAKRRFRVPR